MLKSDTPPKPIIINLPSRRLLVKLNTLEDAFYYDIRENNPHGISISKNNSAEIRAYLKDRLIMTPKKEDIIKEAQSQLSIDKDFLSLVYKGKSLKRKFDKNKFCGNLSMADFAAQEEKIFNKSVPGAKKQSLNIALQVGTFVGGDYEQAFIKIVKTVLMCQAMNISLNIDVFDSDTAALPTGGYIIINIARSHEKLDLRRLLVSSHREFFNYTLFNSYSASGVQQVIGTFLSTSRINQDLSPYYDVIGGNLLQENHTMASQILKIAGIC